MANNIITPDDGFLVKDLRFDPVNTTTHEPITLIVPGDHEKIATGMHPEILTFLGEHPRPKNVTRIIVTALGAFDAYGSNVNGDGFHEKNLLKVPHDIWLGSKKYDQPMYRTFVDFARLYKNHRNKLHDHAYGVIPHSIYNRDMKRVENVLDIFHDDPGNAEVLNNIEDGMFPGVSMGFKCVVGDVCNICQNYDNPHRSRTDYCDHLLYHMNEILPDGRLVYADNPNGYFFDMSVVVRPADRVAWGMAKAASTMVVPDINYWPESKANDMGEFYFTKTAAEIAEENNMQATVKEMEKENSVKAAAIDKDVPGEVEAIVEENPDPEFKIKGLRIIMETDKPISPDFLNRMARSFSFQDIIGTMLGLGVVPSPKEFQRIALTGSGQEEYANVLDEEGIVFDHEGKEGSKYLSPKNLDFNPKLAEQLYKEAVLDERSYWPQYMAKRASMIKQALDAGEFFEKYPIIKNPKPVRKVPEDIQERIIARGIDRSRAGQNQIHTIIGQGSPYIPAQPEGTTLKRVANPLIPLASLAALYAGLQILAGAGAKSPLAQKMKQDPRIAASLFGITAALSWLGQRAGIRSPDLPPGEKRSSTMRDVLKNADDLILQALAGIGLAYALAGRAQNKRAIGKQPNIVEEAFEKKPIFGALATTAGLRALVSAGRKLASEEEGAPNVIDKIADAIAFDGNSIDVLSIRELDEFSRRSLCKSADILIKQYATA